MHTTNYADTFITVAPDSTTPTAREPDPGKPTVARRAFAMIAEAPYTHTSDDVLFAVYADRHDIPEADRPAARAAFFSKGQACLRASDLPKKFGWGVHADGQGRVALVAVESPAYAELAAGRGPAGAPVTVVPAMRSKKG